MTDKFDFVPPPEAPVFRPTEKEFENPLEYIMRIRPIGTKTGICKIIPPASWNPPFAVNMKEFTFTPRIQRLYELEAGSRVKLNFISSLYKFIRSQGGEKIRVPSIGGRFLDLHVLFKLVQEAGGFKRVCENDSWSSVTEKLGYVTKHTQVVKQNYERLLLPFELLISSAPKPHTNGATISKRLRPKLCTNIGDIDFSSNKELRNLRFFGPGPKAAVPVAGNSVQQSAHIDEEVDVDDYRCRQCLSGDDEANLLICRMETCQACYHLYCLNPPLNAVPTGQWKCPRCIRSECLRPPDPYGFPQSSKCYTLHEFGVMADEFKKTYFGRECTDVPCEVVEREFWRILQEYNDDVVVEYGADIHSSSQGSGFPTCSRLNNLVGTAQQLEDAKMYASNSWNLNIIPLLERSVLRFIKGNIDGMKIPWCYVGMVFSSFCWHIEDHWSYSINFNHWGEPKTWYGVSRLNADEFERAMRKHVPELFDQAPDLLHHITTNMNPNILQAEGVPVYRTDQYCGEFVITFPRAYHSGFNQGFNFAEAVNMCLPDWLPIGRECVDHYAEMKRHCVFSNQELLCTLAKVATGYCSPLDVLLVTNSSDPNTVKQKIDEKPESRLPPGCSTAGLDINTIGIVHKEFNILLHEERRLRQAISKLGVENMEQTDFENLPDDNRICDVCMTTLFLSGVSCPCALTAETSTPSTIPLDDEPVVKRSKLRDEVSDQHIPNDKEVEGDDDTHRVKRYMVCLTHYTGLCTKCKPSSWVMHYHHAIEELEKMEKDIAQRLSIYYEWREPLSRLLGNVSCGDSVLDKADYSIPSVPKFPKKSTITENSADKSTDDSPLMSLIELKEYLDIGHAAGYHTDDVDAIFERANHLVHACTVANNAILNPSEAIKKCDEGERNRVRFQFRLPAKIHHTSQPTSSLESQKRATHITPVCLQHEMDVTNLRELDLERLIEACKQLHPLHILDEPSVQTVEHLLDQLDEWRQKARSILSSVCQLVLTKATRSRTLYCSLVSDTPTNSTESPHVPNGRPDEEHACLLLLDLLNQLQSEFPNFASKVSEWNVINLLYEAIKWCCMHQRHLDEKYGLVWTLPRLKQHMIHGEDILKRCSETFAQSSPTSSKSLGRNRQPISMSNTTSWFEAAIAPLSRLIRARMHTAFGQLSHLNVQIESLLSILREALEAKGPISSPEIITVLEQLRSLKVDHLIEWSALNNTPQSLSPSIENDEKPLEADIFQLVHDTSVQYQPPEIVIKLRDLVVDLMCQLLTVIKTAPTIVARPTLSEIEVVISLGDLLDSCVSDSKKRMTSLKKLNAMLVTFKTFVRNTHWAREFLYASLLSDAHLGDIERLLKVLLIPLTKTDSRGVRSQIFIDAFTKSPDGSIDDYNRVVDEMYEFAEGLVTKAPIGLCSDCLRCISFPSVVHNSSHTGCVFCALRTDQAHMISQTSLDKLKDVWFPVNKEAIPLCIVESAAFCGFVTMLENWKNKLVGLLRSNVTLLSIILPNFDPSTSADLSESMKATHSILSADSPPPTIPDQLGDLDIPKFLIKLRILLVVAYLIPFDGLADHIHFCKLVISNLSNHISTTIN